MGLKRFLVFACDCYYPSGGWLDFQSSFKTIDEAKEWMSANVGSHRKFDFGQVVNIETGEEINEENQNDR